MREPLPEWGPAERQARLCLNAMRLELEPSIAQDIITNVLAAFEELRRAAPVAPSGAEAGERNRTEAAALVRALLCHEASTAALHFVKIGGATVSRYEALKWAASEVEKFARAATPAPRRGAAT
jgi:hypothetical protein